jgi:2-polyprenyl-6-methoxyphenol hydroxylase-like FAD-dependent oxidoreductase
VTATIYRGLEVTGFAQDDAGVDVELSDGRSLRAQYLVGCDGGRSLVRKAAGIAFPGSSPTVSNLIAEAEYAETPPEWGIRRDGLGTHALGRVEYEIRDGKIVYADHGPVGVLVTEQRLGQTTETHPRRSQRGAHRRLWDRLWGSLSHLDFPVHRCSATGGGLP